MEITFPPVTIPKIQENHLGQLFQSNAAISSNNAMLARHTPSALHNLTGWKAGSFVVL